MPSISTSVCPRLAPRRNIPESEPGPPFCVISTPGWRCRSSVRLCAPARAISAAPMTVMSASTSAIGCDAARRRDGVGIVQNGLRRLRERERRRHATGQRSTSATRDARLVVDKGNDKATASLTCRNEDRTMALSARCRATPRDSGERAAECRRPRPGRQTEARCGIGPARRWRRLDPCAGRSPGSQVLAARLPGASPRTNRDDAPVALLGDPHSLTVAGAAAGSARRSVRASPHSRFTRREGFAADTCAVELYSGERLRPPGASASARSRAPATCPSPCYNFRPFGNYRPHRITTGPGARL